MTQNLQQIAQLMRGRNPQQVIMQALSNQEIKDPQVVRLVQLAQQGDINNFMNTASALFRDRGLDLNQELNDFMSLLGPM